MSIGQAVSSSLKWMAGMRLLSQILMWIATLLVIRILSPEDYGLMALASVVIGLLEVLDDMGLADALVKKKDPSKTYIKQVFSVLMILSILFYALLYFTAPLIATFYEDERLTLIIHVLGLQLLIRTFFYVPDGIMRRNMDFRSISIINFIATFVQSAVTITLAFTGFGVWALVLGALTATIIKTIGSLIVTRYICLPDFRFREIVEDIKFGALIVVNRLLYYFYDSSDTLIIGKVLGSNLMGTYAVSKQIAELPIDKFMRILNEVGFSAFSTIQDDHEKMKYLLCKAVRVLSLTVFPVFMGISCVSPELVSVVLGEKWISATIPLQIISAVMALKMMNITEPLLFAMGRPDVSVKTLIIGCIIMPIAFYIGAKWGIIGVSLAWLFAYPLYFFIVMKISLATIGLKVFDYIKQFLPAALFSLLMYVAVVFTRYSLDEHIDNEIIQLITLILVGAITYTSLVVIFQRESLKQLYSMVRS